MGISSQFTVWLTALYSAEGCNCCGRCLSLHRAGFRFRLQFDWSHPGLRHIFRLMGPAILGNARRSDQRDREQQFCVSSARSGWACELVGVCLSVHAVAARNLRCCHCFSDPAVHLAERSGEQCRRVSQYAVAIHRARLCPRDPSAVGLAILGDSIVGAVYQFGAFTAFDTQQTGRALACYAIGLVGYSAAKVLNPAFYALHDARTPMIISFCSIAVNFFTVLTMTRVAGFGHAGLALSTSAVAMFSCVALFLVMRKRIGGIYGRNLWRTFSRFCRLGSDGTCRLDDTLPGHSATGNVQTRAFDGPGDLDPHWDTGAVRGVPDAGSNGTRHGPQWYSRALTSETPVAPC